MASAHHWRCASSRPTATTPSGETEDPYRLARDIRGVGFRTADAIAMKMGMTREAPQRVRAGISFALQEATDEGHCGLPVESLIELATKKLLEVDQESIVRSGARSRTRPGRKGHRRCESAASPVDFPTRSLPRRNEAKSPTGWLVIPSSRLPAGGRRSTPKRPSPGSKKKTGKTLAASQRAAIAMKAQLRAQGRR